MCTQIWFWLIHSKALHHNSTIHRHRTRPLRQQHQRPPPRRQMHFNGTPSHRPIRPIRCKNTRPRRWHHRWRASYRRWCAKNRTAFQYPAGHKATTTSECSALAAAVEIVAMVRHVQITASVPSVQPASTRAIRRRICRRPSATTVPAINCTSAAQWWPGGRWVEPHHHCRTVCQRRCSTAAVRVVAVAEQMLSKIAAGQTQKNQTNQKMQNAFSLTVSFHHMYWLLWFEFNFYYFRISILYFLSHSSLCWKLSVKLVKIAHCFPTYSY